MNYYVIICILYLYIIYLWDLFMINVLYLLFNDLCNNGLICNRFKNLVILL